MQTLIQDKISSFATELDQLVRKSALEVLTAALLPEGNGMADVPPSSFREPDSIIRYIKKHPARRADQISAALGRDCKAELAKLREEKAVRTKGLRRGMTYVAR